MAKFEMNALYQQLKEGAEKERAERMEQARKEWELYNQELQKEIQEKQESLDRASKKYFANEQRKREAIIEAEKQKAIAKIEEETEQKLGIKTEKTKKIEDAWRNLSGELNFED
ncbi:hypothetical protein [Streptococcus suis]|uniref:hypothetical protein n=1 Tax=Streptococcus suis TaxID=1307 RepID=UPI000CF52B79|nr:hypothetical protein [Streptococcus suis]